MSKPNNGSEEMVCAFCGKDAGQTMSMVRSENGTYICDECIAVCADTLMHNLGFYEQMQSQDDGISPVGIAKHARMDGSDADRSTTASDESEDMGLPFELDDLPVPSQIYESLSEHVIGQEATKRALSVAVYNHYKRILMGEVKGADEDVEIDKSNIMLLGPTGSGKTLLAQTLARTLKVPFAIADATSLTEAGYVGEDVENILLKLITAADFDIPKSEVGIIYIDEIDKIAKKAENLSLTRDVSGEGVQQALLKIVEGTDASVPPQGGRKHPEQELIHINTKNILFIFGGAFVGLAEIVGQRVGKSGLGFASDMPETKKQADAELLAQVLPEDLNKYGMIPEFVGRIPVITSLDELGEDDLVRILVEPKNALVKQYQKMFLYEDAKLEFDDNALRAIAKECIDHGTGARGLRSICERVLNSIMFELPEVEGPCSITIHASDITGDTTPEIKRAA